MKLSLILVLVMAVMATVAATKKPTTRKPTVKPGAGKPSTAKPVSKKPTTKQPGKPRTGKPVAGKPTTGKPVAGKPTTGKPVAGKPTTGKPVAGPPVNACTLVTALTQANAEPQTGLSLGEDGTTLYGVSPAIESGFDGNFGSIFKVVGTTVSTILKFGAATGGAGNPFAPVVEVGGTLYGTTRPLDSGEGSGALYSVGADGTGYTVLSPINAGDCFAKLLHHNNILYGTTRDANAEAGTVFKYDLTTKVFTTLKTIEGGSIFSPLVLVGTKLFGTTATTAGANNKGAVFSLEAADGSAFSLLRTFSAATGSFPTGGLVANGNTLYGTTERDGTFGVGSIFKLQVDGTGFAVLKQLAGVDFASSTLHLTSGGTLYGFSTFGGASDAGAVFKMSTTGASFVIHYSFLSTQFRNPAFGSFVQVGNFLFGATPTGASKQFGAVYKCSL